jgi:hypothetical protein
MFVNRFQLLGIGCLRAVMINSSTFSKSKYTDSELNPDHFARFSDNTYTSSEVQNMTDLVLASTPKKVVHACTSRHELRRIWHDLKMVGLHIYVTARYVVYICNCVIDYNT